MQTLKRALAAVLALSVVVGAPAAAAVIPQASSDRIPTEKGDLAIHPIQHATFVMQWSGKTLYVDPVGGGDAFRAFPKPDLILITHAHGDHLSAKTIAAVAASNTVIVAPPAVAQLLKKQERSVKVLANGEKTELLDVTIEAIPMYNLTPERQRFHPKGQGNGYVLKIGGKRVYIAGDTEDIPEMRKLENIDVAFVCVNLPYTMDVKQAADAVLEFKPRIVFPYHYRGTKGKSDLRLFKKLVGEESSIEVRLRNWYP